MYILSHQGLIMYIHSIIMYIHCLNMHIRIFVAPGAHYI